MQTSFRVLFLYTACAAAAPLAASEPASSSPPQAVPVVDVSSPRYPATLPYTLIVKRMRAFRQEKYPRVTMQVTAKSRTPGMTTPVRLWIQGATTDVALAVRDGVVEVPILPAAVDEGALLVSNLPRRDLEVGIRLHTDIPLVPRYRLADLAEALAQTRAAVADMFAWYEAPRSADLSGVMFTLDAGEAGAVLRRGERTEALAADAGTGRLFVPLGEIRAGDTGELAFAGLPTGAYVSATPR